MDFGIQPFQISSALLGVAATRLMRKLCTTCKEVYEPNAHELEMLNVTPDEIKGKKIYRAGGGCEACFGQGYKDRIGVYELLIFDDDMRGKILETQDAKAIKKLAIEKGMTTLRDAALVKVLQGITSLDEAIRKTQTDELEVNEEGLE